MQIKLKCSKSTDPRRRNTSGRATELKYELILAKSP